MMWGTLRRNFLLEARTPAVWLVLVAVAGGFAWLITPSVLAWLPPPADEAGLAPFTGLATGGFRSAVSLAASGSTAIVLWAVDPQLWPVWIPFVIGGSLLAAIDFRTIHLPRRLNWVTTGTVFGCVLVVAALSRDGQILAGSVGGAAAAGALFGAAWWLGAAVGFGDVRLMVLIGATVGTLGPLAVLCAITLGVAAGAVWGIAGWLGDRQNKELPYGPALLLGAVLAAPVVGWI